MGLGSCLVPNFYSYPITLTTKPENTYICEGKITRRASPYSHNVVQKTRDSTFLQKQEANHEEFTSYR